MNPQEKTTGDLLRRVVPPIALAWVFLPLAFLIPWLNSTGSPYFDLTGWIGTFAYVLSVAGGSKGTPFVIVFLILVVVSRPGRSLKQRGIEFLVLALVGGGLLGVGSLLNEKGIKELVKEPRPHVKLLARTPTDTPPEASILTTTADDFYEDAGDVREANLEKISKLDSLEALGDRFCFEAYGEKDLFLSKNVCHQWISATSGFSFPSGHSFSALFLATFFLGMALYVLGGWRLALFKYLVVPYGVLVCYSRTVLRVHSPLDISVGGLLGIGIGLVALVLVVKVLKRVGGKTVHY